MYIVYSVQEVRDGEEELVERGAGAGVPRLRDPAAHRRPQQGWVRPGLQRRNPYTRQTVRQDQCKLSFSCILF